MPTETSEFVGQSAAVKRCFGQSQQTVADGGELVIDVRGLVGIAAYFAGGDSCNATPCDSEGAPLANATAAALTSGQTLAVVDKPAHFYLVEPTGGAAVVLGIG